MRRRRGLTTRLRALTALPALRRLRNDRGSGAIAVVLFALVVLALAAFVVDSGMAISQRERAMDYAEQAARYAAQDIDVEALREEGPPAPINFGNCEQNIAEYANEIGLSDADVQASYCISGETQANQVTVRIRVTYTPIFTGMLYDGPLEVWGEATAEAQTG
ncbi:TadE/TadG family type IV pilus assembly protein [Streptomyces sp. 6N223]|uniref:TadE/TadG family type IV pilus assembly protein n=1 Tax=Streptomyces sp. 6N223 TaxID=3457412 RepID=UPI003FD4041C